jgi:hypothetical protein
MKNLIKTVLFVCALSFCVASAATAQNYKITQRISLNGKHTDSTVLIKGARKRTKGVVFMGISNDVDIVEQCDLHRTIEINDKKKLYFIRQAEAEEPASVNTPGTKAKTKRGGVITMNYSTTDTGERRQMFGMTARHIKTKTTTTSSPDACNPQNMATETDGWYVDLTTLSCPVALPENPIAAAVGNTGGCQDRTVVKQTGNAKLGFALSLTQTMKMTGEDDIPPFIQTIETLELTSAAQNVALFDIPKGYQLASKASELCDSPSKGAIMNAISSFGSGDSDDEDDQPVKTKPVKTTGGVKPAYASVNKPVQNTGPVKICVYAPTNRVGDDISETNMKTFLTTAIYQLGVDASEISADTDTRGAGCTYTLATDFTKLTQSTASRVGGFLGKMTNTDTSGARTYEAQVVFKVMGIGDDSTVYSDKVTVKGENDADRAAEAALTQVAQMVVSKFSLTR